MKIYRIAKQQFISDLSGEGARLYGGRWNKPGHNMLYCSKQLSLSVLELLVHVDYQFINQNFWFIEIEIPEVIDIPKVPSKILKQDWRHNPPLELTQNYGTDWLKSNKKLALSVPSAVLPNEHNILLNPNHIDFKNVQITKKEILDIDARVFK
ncbi:RES family NAD+ phosphorylase [uncultured Algibacter sp.]|uniref:RES family NAD+ phosphorylase n=1 Tax=uncultured Algibacter sp. TaxID=298659 RepID=UPI003216C6E0